MIRKAVIVLSCFLAVAVLMFGLISMKMDIIFRESEYIPTKVNPNKPWKLLDPSLGSNRDQPQACIGFCDGDFRIDYWAAIQETAQASRADGTKTSITQIWLPNRPLRPKINGLFFCYRDGWLHSVISNNTKPAYAAKLTVSSWALFVLFSVYPTIVFIRGPYRRYRRRKKGLCPICGYNLTGNVSGVCPECGKKI